MTRDVGWIGLGRMGLPMAEHALAAGHRLHVWARNPAHAAPLRARGATWAADPEALARQADIVVTIVGGPDDVRALHDRMLPHARHDAVFVDMTTASPRTEEASSKLAADHGAHVIDAPVTGGVGGARAGTLTAFVGGAAGVIERARPLLETFCARLVPCGATGAGYRMKLVNQTMIAGTLLGLVNGTLLARAFGFDAAQVADALREGTASGRLFDSYVARMMTGDATTTFSLGLLRKDVRLARDEAQRFGSTAFHDFALHVLDEACARHGEDAGVQCLAFR
jgi:3-hydroxyisobutyrate dehydrogenase-like beta-hydroxyacid dehydrogenase